jgi:triacylglycerol esterase/lipase EstA (alpha/beta hydrolase family)
MGGLVARAYLRAHGTARLAHLITLGTPHHGTALARVAVGRSARQMRRTGEPGAWLAALAASEDAALRAHITSIYTEHDNIVVPSSSSVLAGARHIVFTGIGHVALGGNRRVLACLGAEIVRARATNSSV